MFSKVRLKAKSLFSQENGCESRVPQIDEVNVPEKMELKDFVSITRVYDTVATLKYSYANVLQCSPLSNSAVCLSCVGLASNRTTRLEDSDIYVFNSQFNKQ